MAEHRTVEGFEFFQMRCKLLTVTVTKVRQGMLRSIPSRLGELFALAVKIDEDLNWMGIRYFVRSAPIFGGLQSRIRDFVHQHRYFAISSSEFEISDRDPSLGILRIRGNK